VRNRLLLVFLAVPFLLAAAFWNPSADLTRYDSSRWIESGLESERHGDFAAAERSLLEAAQIDRLYQPRWALAGFYFRRNDTGNFRRWMGEALTVGSRDLGALFDLCWRLPDGCPNLRGTVMPDSRPVWDEYLYYLMTTGKWQPAGNMAEAIANRAEAGDVPLLMNYCDSALAHGDKVAANAVWFHLCYRKLLPFSAGRIIANGDFRIAPSGRGFDWRIAAPGVGNPFRPGEVSFTFNGYQHEREVLLEQPLAIDPSLKYRLEFEYRTDRLDPNAGTHWTAGANISEGFAASTWTTGRFDFTGPAESLQLVYQRPAGSTLAEGTLWVRNVNVVVR
jgi:hypothetical protein